MKIRIEFDTDAPMFRSNFSGGVAYVLHQAGKSLELQIDNPQADDLLLDITGNVVGTVVFRRKQCPCILTTKSSLIFCGKDEGHKGHHRGTGAQWTSKRRVKVSEPTVEEQKRLARKRRQG